MKPPKDFSIVIADDHPLLLSGLYEELTKKGYHVVGQASNGSHALELILTQHPTLAFLDIDMPVLTGFEVIKFAREKGSKTKFIVLSFHKESEYVLQAKGLQINGYLLKEDPFLEIEKCMRIVLDGGDYFSQSFKTNSLHHASKEFEKLSLLTSSELMILKLIAQQNSNKKIADTLYVSVRTIEKHRSNILGKLELDSATNSLTSWALINKKTILEY